MFISFFADDAGCPLDLLLVSGQPNTLTNSEMQHLKLYMKARVGTFLGKYPEHYVGVVHFANGPLLACRMTNSVEDLHQCIDVNVTKQRGEFLQTQSAIALAGAYLNDWWHNNHETLPNRNAASFAVECMFCIRTLKEIPHDHELV